MSPRGERIQVRFPDRIKREIERMAEEKGTTEGRIVVELVEKALSHDLDEMNQKIISLHETLQTVLERLKTLEEEA